jgi:hypothetical protein
LQALVSLQSLPFATGGFEQIPVAGSHAPTLWQRSGAVQEIDDPDWHAPPVQTSPVVHRFPSLHAVPLATAGFEQVPVAGSQTPTV